MYDIYRDSFPEINGRGMALTTHHRLALRLEKGRSGVL
jgi:hypothetical protein